MGPRDPGQQETSRPQLPVRVQGQVVEQAQGAARHRRALGPGFVQRARHECTHRVEATLPRGLIAAGAPVREIYFRLLQRGRITERAVHQSATKRPWRSSIPSNSCGSRSESSATRWWRKVRKRVSGLNIADGIGGKYAIRSVNNLCTPASFS